MKINEIRCLEILLTPEERETLKKVADIVDEIYREMGRYGDYYIRGNKADWCHADFEEIANILRDWADADKLTTED